MKKIILALVALFMIPSVAYAITVPWNKIVPGKIYPPLIGDFVGVGTTSASWPLSVVGIGSFDDFVRASRYIATSTTASSTFANGLNLTSGCFSINNVCVGTAVGAITGTGGANTMTYWITPTTVGGTSSPTVSIITATSTNATSTLPKLRIGPMGPELYTSGDFGSLVIAGPNGATLNCVRLGVTANDTALCQTTDSDTNPQLLVVKADGSQQKINFGTGGFAPKPVTITTSQNSNTTDFTYFADATAGDVVLTMIGADERPGQLFFVYKKDGSANIVHVFDNNCGIDIATLEAQGQFAIIQSDENVIGCYVALFDSSASGVSSVSNSDGSLTISPTTGNVVASIDTSHSNTWSVPQFFLDTTNSNQAIVAASQDGQYFAYIADHDNGRAGFFQGPSGASGAFGTAGGLAGQFLGGDVTIGSVVANSDRLFLQSPFGGFFASSTGIFDGDLFAKTKVMIATTTTTYALNVTGTGYMDKVWVGTPADFGQQFWVGAPTGDSFGRVNSQNGSTYWDMTASQNGVSNGVAANRFATNAAFRAIAGINTGSTAYDIDTSNSGLFTGTPEFRITATGLIGISTTTPSARLSVTGSGTGTGRLFTLANSSNAEKFLVLDNGSVGIGTLGSTIGASLDVKGFSGQMPFRVASTTGTSLFEVEQSGNVGIATTSASATLGITGNSTTNPVYISTTTATVASSTLFMIDKAGDHHYGGGTPTISSCGTGPTLDANSTDQAGTVTFGASATGCTLTFSTPKASKPHCIWSTQAVSLVNAITFTESATAITWTQAASGGTSFDYFCPLGH